jgi:predicted nucleic acid-binding Zn ribbon protein
MAEAPLRKCPECGKSQLKRLVSASQFRLKGSGWYETDFKNKSETKRNLVEHGGSGSSEAADKSTDTAAKDEAGKAVAAAKDAAGGAAEKAAKPKPVSAKPAAAARNSKSKSRAKAARG